MLIQGNTDKNFVRNPRYGFLPKAQTSEQDTHFHWLPSLQSVSFLKGNWFLVCLLSDFGSKHLNSFNLTNLPHTFKKIISMLVPKGYRRLQTEQAMFLILRLAEPFVQGTDGRKKNLKEKTRGESRGM